MAKTSKSKREYRPKPSESTGSKGDTFARLFESKTLSTAWIDLSASAKVLFMTCSAQPYTQKPKPNPANDQRFYMNQSLWLHKYHLYSKANLGGFYRDMNSLVNHGFICCIENGANSRTKSVYEFSDGWKAFGTDAFAVSPKILTQAGRRKSAEK